MFDYVIEYNGPHVRPNVSAVRIRSVIGWSHGCGIYSHIQCGRLAKIVKANTE